VYLLVQTFSGGARTRHDARSDDRSSVRFQVLRASARAMRTRGWAAGVNGR